MKRSLLVFLLAAVLLGLAAAPAFALEGAFKTAYVVPKTGGVWLEAVGTPSAPTLLVHPPLSPIPANYDVVIDSPWRGITRGLVQTVPLSLKYEMTIVDLGVSLSREQSMAYWSGAVLWDDYWRSLLGPIPAFRALGTKAYANHWWASLTGSGGVATKNVTADKKLVQGTYVGQYREIVLRTITDLKANSTDPPTPVQRQPGTTPWYQFTFVLGPPVP